MLFNKFIALLSVTIPLLSRLPILTPLIEKKTSAHTPPTKTARRLALLVGRVFWSRLGKRRCYERYNPLNISRECNVQTKGKIGTKVRVNICDILWLSDKEKRRRGEKASVYIRNKTRLQDRRSFATRVNGILRSKLVGVVEGDDGWMN